MTSYEFLVFLTHNFRLHASAVSQPCACASHSHNDGAAQPGADFFITLWMNSRIYICIPFFYEQSKFVLIFYAL